MGITFQQTSPRHVRSDGIIKFCLLLKLSDEQISHRAGQPPAGWMLSHHQYTLASIPPARETMSAGNQTSRPTAVQSPLHQKAATKPDPIPNQFHLQTADSLMGTLKRRRACQGGFSESRHVTRWSNRWRVKEGTCESLEGTEIFLTSFLCPVSLTTEHFPVGTVSRAKTTPVARKKHS